MLVLILDSRTALEGMRSAVELYLQTLIPSLFPFFVLCVYLTGNLAGCDFRLLRPLCRVLAIPDGAQMLLITGFLGGYPTGAQSVAQAYENGQLSRTKANRLLAFCSNAGPACLFGGVGQAFDSPSAPWMLWLIHIISAVLVGIISQEHSGQVFLPRNTVPISLTQSLRKTIAVMAQVCGWVAVFRMILCYLDRWFGWLLPDSLGVIIAGILELSNGCIRLREVESEGIRFVAASALTALGGLCVFLQTRSVTGTLSLRYYFAGKLLQSAFSILLASIWVRQPLTPWLWSVIGLIGVISILILRKTEKNSSIPAAFGV